MNIAHLQAQMNPVKSTLFHEEGKKFLIKYTTASWIEEDSP